jgi:uncharacterized membrane protein
MGMTNRLVVVDLARTLALCAMAVFHFTFDLELFGHLPQGTTVTGGWAVFARVIAGSFLFLSGVSLVLAHGKAVRWPSFRNRLLRVAGAAALVTGATLVALPQAFIFFGILHAIAFGSVIGILLIRAPAMLLLVLAAGVLGVNHVVALEVMNPRWLVWTGLGDRQPWTMDFVPVFPWIAAVLGGMAAAKLAERGGLWARLPMGGPVLQRLAWPGRHSLAIYLIHQPVLITLVWLGTLGLR